MHYQNHSNFSSVAYSTQEEAWLAEKNSHILTFKLSNVQIFNAVAFLPVFCITDGESKMNILWLLINQVNPSNKSREHNVSKLQLKNLLQVKARSNYRFHVCEQGLQIRFAAFVYFKKVCSACFANKTLQSKSFQFFQYHILHRKTTNLRIKILSI